jgi:predicted ATP-grasp superfamily ATP-dependent carboligase
MIKYKKIDNFDWTPFEKIFTKLKYTGFACIDFKMINSKIKIFEINPRLGGTIVHDPEDFSTLIELIRNQIY